MPITLAQLQPLMGKEFTHPDGKGLYFHVIIRDVRSMFGRTEILVEPVSGSGSRWIELPAGLMPNETP